MAPRDIILFRFIAEDTVILDPVADVYSPKLGAAFTWRRLNQDHPDCTAIGAFSLDDLSNPEKTIAPQISDHVFFKAKDTSDAPLIATMIAARVLAEKNSHGEDWGYHHSPRYEALMERNRLEAEHFKEGNLAPWELELMGASN